MHSIGQGTALFRIRVEDHLDKAGAIPDVEKDNAAVIPAPLNPTTERDRFALVRRPQRPAIMTTHERPFR